MDNDLKKKVLNISKDNKSNNVEAMEAKAGQSQAIATNTRPQSSNNKRRKPSPLSVLRNEHLKSKTEIHKQREEPTGNKRKKDKDVSKNTSKLKDKLELRTSLPNKDLEEEKDTHTAKKIRNRSENHANQNAEKTKSCTLIGEECYDYKIAIMHEKHPKEFLTLQQIQRIRMLLLKELDKNEDRSVYLNFVASTLGEGWFTLTCHNEQTQEWLMSSVQKIQPLLDTNIKVIPVNDRYMCIVYLPAEDAMPQEIFLSRLNKQNLGLSTDEWRVLSMFDVQNGRQCITLSIDEISKEIIQSQNGKLFLNFSQIDAYIEKAVQFIGTRQNNNEQSALKASQSFTCTEHEALSSNAESSGVENLVDPETMEIYENATRTMIKNVPMLPKFNLNSAVYPTKILASLKTSDENICRNAMIPKKVTNKSKSNEISLYKKTPN